MLCLGLGLVIGCGGSGTGKQDPSIQGDLNDSRNVEDLLCETRDDAEDAPFGPFDSEMPDYGPKCEAEPFAFGCPCKANEQCEGGFCVNSTFGYICTQECVTECPDPEYYECKGMTGFGPDMVFLCIPKSVPLCQPCESNDQCEDGICVSVAGAMRCTATCDQGKACPVGYECNEALDEPVCFPASGDCSCIEKTRGTIRTCEVSNGFGVCKGIETCDPEVGFVDCTAATPASESCDGFDNDCDGQLDDGLGDPPVCGTGVCTAVGVCAGVLGWQCDAPPVEAEACDFKDNDCDGSVDEDFAPDGSYSGLNHCGTCNHDCVGTIPNAVEVCDAGGPVPQCAVGECDPGYFQWNAYQCLPEGQVLCKPCSSDLECGGGTCISALGGSFCTQSCLATPCPESFECVPVGGEEGKWCLPISGACDCFDELAGSTKPCVASGDLGSCGGVQTCNPLLGWSPCSASAPKEESCDGLDNDCDGIPDDGFGGGKECEKTVVGIGTCKGNQYCAGNLGIVCDAPTPTQENCDYADNDCDGQVDEDFLVGGKFATLHHCGACNKDCDGAFPHATAFCDGSPAVPECKVQTCEQGYFKLNDYQCVPAQAVECKPCVTDLDCYALKCVPLEEGSYCLDPCDGGGGCPEAHHCETLDIYGTICVPDSGSCVCSATTAGAKKGCTVSNDLGTCFGFETCDPAKGWTDCTAGTPAEEVCDGQDNDCNGIADDGLLDAEPCVSTNEWGTCAGISTCKAGAGWYCDAPDPEEEACNGLDDDCDGEKDEGFLADGKYMLPDHCGKCGTSCIGAVTNGVAKCDGTYLLPKCVVDSCDEGYYQASLTECMPKPDTTCEPCKSDVQCLGGVCVAFDDKLRCAIPCSTDQDCGVDMACLDYPGKGTLCQPVTGSCECTSATVGSKRACAKSNDIGTCTGIQTCKAVTGWSECSALLPSAETCNGLDDDCNGTVDEGFEDSVPCENTNEWGVCSGWSTCLGKLGMLCSADVPAEDVCNYQDDNCDGIEDESFVVNGKYVLTDHCGTCATNCAGAVPNGTAKCDAASLVPKCVVEQCDEGYYAASPTQCLLKPDTTCEPCKTDDQCLGAACITIDEQQRCAIPCTGDLDCGSEMVCKPYLDKGMLCQPVTGSCECSSANAGAKRACAFTNPLGTCAGVQTCNASTGWSPCSAAPPSAELCNGLDDDCDFSVDEGFEGATTCTNTNEWGTCSGWNTCQGKAGFVCTAGIPAEDVCNYVDDDCDGTVDEDFTVGGKYASTEHCGTCSTDCSGLIPHGAAKCDPSYLIPKCVVDQCDDGYYPVNPFTCQPEPDTTCEPCVTDADCLGGLCIVLDGKSRCSVECTTDVDCKGEHVCTDYPGVGLLCQPPTGSCDCNSGTAGTKRYCTNSNPIGTCSGFQICDPLVGWSECGAPIPSLEICNGVDDDCNGKIDDGLPATQPCEKVNEHGTCTGSASCAGALGWLCQASTAEPEVCDKKDNDCDGSSDEDFQQNGKYVLFDHCGACNTSCASGFPNATAECDSLAPVPECVVAQCDPGFTKINKYQCVNSVGTLCSPCAVTADCVQPGAQCIQLNDGKYCMSACVNDSECAMGFKCKPAGGSTACLPVTNSCTCTPVKVGSVSPKETCIGTQTITLLGTGFGVGTLVYLGEQAAANITVVSAEEVKATFNDLQPGKYALTVSNGGICVATLPDAVTIIAKPSLFFVDPPVAYNGISVQVTAFVTNIQGGGVTFFGIRPSGTQQGFVALQYNFSPDSPRRVKAIVPSGLTPGLYDVQLEVAVGCGAILEEALSITNTIAVNLTAIEPSFGWTQAATAVNLYAAPLPAEGKTGFKSLPRAYLNPTNPGPNELAAGIGAIGFVDETRLTGVVPKGLKVGFYDLVVVNPDGGVGLLKNAFGVTEAAPPVINSVSPGSVPNNIQPDVTILGKNFYGPALHLTCKAPAGQTTSLQGVVKNWNATSISAQAPTKGLAAGTVCLVRVTNADGSYWEYSALGITTSSENLEPMVFVSSMATPRRAPAVVTARATTTAQFLYALGGDSGSASGALGTIEAAPLDPYGVLGSWRSIPGGLAAPRTLATAVRAGQFLYLAGGNDGNGPVSSVLRARVLAPQDAPALDDLTLDLGATGLTNGVWYYRVSAVKSAADPDNPGGETLPSDPLPVFVPPGLPGPLVPTVYWKSVSNAAAYRIYRSPSPGMAAGSERLVTTVDGTTGSWTDFGTPVQLAVKAPTIGDLGAWHSLPSLKKAREGAQMAYAADPGNATLAYLYVVGGRTADGTPLPTYEVLKLDASTGRPAAGADWIEVIENPLSVGRWQLALFVVDGSVTTHTAPGDVWLFAGPGMGSGGTLLSNVDGARVQAGGLLTTWGASAALAPALVGCGFAAAANQLWAFGGQNAKPSVGGKSAQLCGVGSNCGALPNLASWNAGVQLKQDRYLMGSTVGAAHILIVGGVASGNQPLSSVETTVW